MPQLVRALAFQGNALRAQSDYGGALALLGRARSTMETAKRVELSVRAELHGFLGSLFTTLRKPDLARRHLDDEAALYEILGDDEGCCRALVKVVRSHTVGREHKLAWGSPSNRSNLSRFAATAGRLVDDRGWAACCALLAGWEGVSWGAGWR